ncbi:MAG TPA: ribonuclease P protein component [Leptospiraceae bacterium]|nr:ribonuclease P protein component [Spirochaetaceae bacterium]HBS04494.1 ribonuclease P protein component [Leptospiraceae bacterium]
MKRATLKGRTAFADLFSRGRRFHSRNTAIMVLSTADERTLIAFCVSRRTGKAVVRNRIRRKCRVSLEPLMDRLPPGWRIAILPGRSWTTMPAETGTREVIRLLDRAGIQLLDGPEKQPDPSSNSTN